MNLGTNQSEHASNVYNYEQSKEYGQDTKNVPPNVALSDMAKKAPDASGKIYPKSSFSDTYSSVADAQSLDEILSNRKRASLGQMIICHGHSIIPSVRVGHCVKVTGMSQFDGLYWVSSVVHLFDQSGKYHNNFTCTPLDIAFADQVATRKRMANIQSGIVVDNADPDKLGRVKIKFPWSDSNETCWVRVLTLHAGQEWGWYSIPEIDDEVLVGYEQGNPDYPVILGALYNKDKPPSQDSQVDQNMVKMFYTKGGNKIIIRDEEGKEAIELSTKDGKNSVVMEMGGPSIAISSDGDITISGANITLKGSGDIKIESDSKVIAKAGADMELNAAANMKVEASANQDIKGAMVNVKGNPINLN
jgi:uncharacterized protein involved in type VI secretion and phage assembly